MEKIYLRKYGFERAPMKDVNSWGYEWKGFRVGELFLLKARRDGRLYINCLNDCIDGKLDRTHPYLLHWPALKRFSRGVSIASLTDKDLESFYSDCVEYVKEYKAVVSAIRFPTEAKIKEKAECIRQRREREYNMITEEMNPKKLYALIGLDKINQFICQYRNLWEEAFEPDLRIADMLGKESSIEYINSFPQISHYFEECRALLEEVK